MFSYIVLFCSRCRLMVAREEEQSLPTPCSGDVTGVGGGWWVIGLRDLC